MPETGDGGGGGTPCCFIAFSTVHSLVYILYHRSGEKEVVCVKRNKKIYRARHALADACSRRPMVAMATDA